MKRIALNITFISLLTLLFIPVKVYALTYKFPWADGVTWEWFDTSPLWHIYESGSTRACNSSDTSCAVDVGYDGLAGTDDYRHVVAVADGEIDSICYDAKTINLRVTNNDGYLVRYWRLDKNSVPSNIEPFSQISRGEYLGRALRGSFSESCGTTSQGATDFHLHWKFTIKDGGGYLDNVFDGWTLTYPDDEMTNGGSTVEDGENVDSTNDVIVEGGTLDGGETVAAPNGVSVKATTTIKSTGGTVTIKTD